MDHLDSYYKKYINAKILIPKKFIEKAVTLKNNGKQIVFTNGCFDIIHQGHISILSQAKQLGDYLFVAVNSDQSIKNYKGNLRPINNLEARIEVLASLSMVDYVSYFEEDTPKELIYKIIPNCLVKGGDWKTEDIVGSKIVLKNNGKVKSLPYKKGNSTTIIIDRIIKLNNERNKN